jgi:hypothetical protein
MEVSSAHTFTAADIRREHEAALAALTQEQRRALDRLTRARQQSPFNQRWPSENLARLFEAEAAIRNEDLPVNVQAR